MAIKEISRVFDPHQAAEIVTLENSLGVRHVLTIHIADHEACPGCGHQLRTTAAGEVDVEATVAAAVKEFEAHERKLKAHVKRRKK